MRISFISIAATADERHEGNHAVTITAAPDDRVRTTVDARYVEATGARLAGPWVSVQFRNDEGTRAMLREVLAQMGTVVKQVSAS